MYTEGFEQMFKMNKNMSQPLQEWNKNCTEMCRRIAQQNLDLISDNVTRLSDQLKRFTHAKKPEDFFNLQKDCMNEDMAATMETVQKVIHTSMENMEQLTKMCGTAMREPMHAMEKEREREKSSK